MNSHPEDTQRHESDLLEAADRIAELRQQLAAAEQREAVLRECVKKCADTSNWGTSKTGCDQWVLTTHGCESAQAALAKVEGMRGGNNAH